MVGGGAIHNTEVSLNTGIIQRLRRASSYDQVLLLGQALLDSLSDIATASTIRIRNIDGTVIEIVPAKHLLSP